MSKRIIRKKKQKVESRLEKWIKNYAKPVGKQIIIGLSAEILIKVVRALIAFLFS
jgi:hypothetical protein